MRVLHATDFSPTAERARTLAVDIARRAAGTLHVVHVQQTFQEGHGRAFLPAGSDAINPDLQRRLEEERQVETRALMERLADLTDGRATTELVWGEPRRELLRLANDADLVVMGAHGRTPFDEVFLGGVAGYVVRRTSTPVLTVRENCPTRQLGRLLVATDFQEAALGAWTFANWFAERTLVKLVLAHVEEGPPGPAGSSQARLETLSAGRAERIVVAGGNPIDTLPTLAAELGADAIVVGMRRHGALAGLIMGARGDALVRSSPIPILSVPAT
ncbi:MAG: universal stress protein [Trueperaceae bacterium]|nr:universal stress protein [Trueperaceae bacterium]